MVHMLVSMLVAAVAVGVIGFLVRCTSGERRWPWVAFAVVCVSVGVVLLVQGWNAQHSNGRLGVALGISFGATLAGMAWDIRRWRLRRRSA